MKRRKNMNWKFWEKENADGTQKLSGPKEMIQHIGGHLVTALNKDPNWVWKLKICFRPNAGGNGFQDFRIFDPGQASMVKVTVKNFSTLDDHCDLILYEGTFNKKTKELKIKEKGKA